MKIRGVVGVPGSEEDNPVYTREGVDENVGVDIVPGFKLRAGIDTGRISSVKSVADAFLPPGL